MGSSFLCRAMLQHTYFYFWLECPSFLPQTSEHPWLVPGKLEVGLKALFVSFQVYVLDWVVKSAQSQYCWNSSLYFMNSNGLCSWKWFHPKPKWTAYSGACFAFKSLSIFKHFSKNVALFWNPLRRNASLWKENKNIFKVLNFRCSFSLVPIWFPLYCYGKVNPVILIWQVWALYFLDFYIFWISFIPTVY